MRVTSLLAALVVGLAAFAMQAPAAHATGLTVTCSPSSSVVVGCDQVIPHRENFSPGDLGVFRYISRSPARNVNRIGVYTDATNTAESFQLSLWAGTANRATSRIGLCNVEDVEPNAWNSCSFPDVWVPGGLYRYLGILQPEEGVGDVWIRTAELWGDAPEFLDFDRALATTPSTFTKGNTYAGASPASFYVADAVAPMVTFGSRPAELTNGTSASWSWSADEPSMFECSLDGVAFAACASPHEVTSLGEGAHEFRVRATDAADNTATVSDGWTVDLTAPTIEFTDSPPDGPGTGVTWAWSSNDPSASFACALDAAVYTTCTSPTTIQDVGVGAHTFHLRATDAAGNSSSLDDGFTVQPPGPSANLWIDGDGGGCIRSAVPAVYDDQTACADLDEAYQAAQTGDDVRVKAGSYGLQETASDNTSLTGPVTVQPATGETVTFASLTTRGDWLHLKDIAIPTASNHVRGWYNLGGSHNELENVDISGPHANVYFDGGSNNTYRDSAFGTPGNTTPRVCGTGDAEPMDVSNSPNFTVNRVVFHPFWPDTNNPVCGPDSTQHLETIRVNDGMDDMRVLNSVFMDGDGSNTARIFITKLSPPGTGDNTDRFTLANTYIGDSQGTVSVYLRSNQQCVDYKIAYNFWRQAFIDECSIVDANSLTFIGNLATQPHYLPCPGSQPGRKNLWVWTDSRNDCGTDQWLVSSAPLLDAYQHAPDGYHLTATSPAIDAGEPLANCDDYTGGVDIDGDPRGPTCDAGPDEHTGG